jgi:hypothetical protein
VFIRWVVGNSNAKSANSLEFDVHDVSYLSKAALKILDASMFRKAADVDFVRLETVTCKHEYRAIAESKRGRTRQNTESEAKSQE